LLVAFFLLLLQWPKTGGGGGGTGNGSVAVTMVADTLPASPSPLPFRSRLRRLSFTTSSGTSTTRQPDPALTVDLMRLQTDTVFLGLFPNIPSAQYVSATLFLSGNANITFLNDTGFTLSGCLTSHVCPLSVAVSSNPVATVSFTVSQNAVSGIALISTYSTPYPSPGTPANLVVNFNNANVLTPLLFLAQIPILPPASLISSEDFTGVVTINSQSVTLASAPVTGRGSLTASATLHHIL